MIFIKFFILFLLSISLYSKEMYFDTISLSKVKKLIKKEEQIAKAYKDYILENGKKPTSTSLINLTLPEGFSNSNLFGSTLTLHSSEAYIINEIPSSVKSALYDEYYSNKNRVYTKAPSSKMNKNVYIVLSSKEKYILTYSADIIKTTYPKYILDDQGVLHWYKTASELIYSYDDKLIVYPSANFLDDDGLVLDSFKSELNDKQVLYPGQVILNINNNIAEEYLNIGDNNGIIKVSDTSNIGKTVISFRKNSSSMIINGDIYTWGNNAYETVGLGTNTYTGKTSDGDFSVITGLVRSKAMIYDTDIANDFNNVNYFSSPLRPKFDDIFSSTTHGTCGITGNGELYCGGSSSSRYSFGENFTHVVDFEGNELSNNAPEMLYRSSFFNGTDKKALKLLADNTMWIILSQDGNIYRWGYDEGYGLAGNGDKTFNIDGDDNPNEVNKIPEKINIIDGTKDIKISDITSLISTDYRRMAALSQNGDIYIWGIEKSMNNCLKTWDGLVMNLCLPLKVDTTNDSGDEIKFKSIQGGLRDFIAVSTDNQFYRIDQPKRKKPRVFSINDELITNYSDELDDSKILSLDLSNKISSSIDEWKDGIVWVNGNNELKGNYFTNEYFSSNYEDKVFFKSAISTIKWKKIKVIDDDNSMCGIDINNQMYCWGKMSFDSSGKRKNTFILPIFNTNLYDLSKDFLVVESGRNYITDMTSGEWTSNDSSFFIKYPTYIGGFNYEFIFK